MIIGLAVQIWRFKKFKLEMCFREISNGLHLSGSLNILEMIPKLTSTWQLTMTGQLTLVPKRASQRVSKSASKGAAELQMGMRLWVNLGNCSLSPSMTSWRETISSTLISLSTLATLVTLTLPSLSSALFFKTLTNSSSSALTLAPKHDNCISIMGWLLLLIR